MSVVSTCADDAFGLTQYYWDQFYNANAQIKNCDEQIKSATAGPAQYSMDSTQNRFSTMTHRLGEFTKAREYWVSQRLDAILNLQRLGVGVDECCSETGLTVMVPAH